MAAKKKADSSPREPIEREISTADLLALEVGNTVFMYGEDKDGSQRSVACTVAGTGKNKFLTYRDAQGHIRKCAIKDYPGKRYVRLI